MYRVHGQTQEEISRHRRRVISFTHRFLADLRHAVQQVVTDEFVRVSNGPFFAAQSAAWRDYVHMGIVRSRMTARRLKRTADAYFRAEVVLRVQLNPISRAAHLAWLQRAVDDLDALADQELLQLQRLLPANTTIRRAPAPAPPAPQTSPGRLDVLAAGVVLDHVLRLPG